MNTEVDFNTGLDNPEKTSDRMIVDGLLTPKDIKRSYQFWYAVAIACILPSLANPLISNTKLMSIFAPMFATSYYYTANPIAFKYNALGEFVVVYCTILAF